MTPPPLSQDILLPVVLNEKTNEPYLRLPAPHSNIILTPPRQADANKIVEILNDPQIVKWLSGPPYPYHLDHAHQWLEDISNHSKQILDELKTKPIGEFVGGCPFGCIREVKDNGEEIFLGACTISGWTYVEVGDTEERTRLTNENHALPSGHPDKEWGIGDYLATSHHGKGIMSLVVKTLIEQWIIPRMGAKKITTTVYEGNIASVRVFEKSGFNVEEMLENYLALPESKGGGTIGIHVLKWRH